MQYFFITTEVYKLLCHSNNQGETHPIQYIQKQSIKSLYQGIIRRKPLFSICQKLVSVCYSCGKFWESLRDFPGVLWEAKGAKKQMRKHLEVSSTAEIAGSPPIKPLSQGVVWCRRSSLLWVLPVWVKISHKFAYLLSDLYFMLIY